MKSSEEQFYEQIEEAYQNGHVDFLVQIAIYLQEKEGVNLTNSDITKMREDILSTLDLFKGALDFEI